MDGKEEGQDSNEGPSNDVPCARFPHEVAEAHHGIEDPQIGHLVQ